MFRKTAMLGSALALILPALAAPAGAETTYVYGDSGAPSEPRPREATIPWLEMLSERSDGRIKTGFMGGGAVVTAKNGMSAMRDGLIDGAFVSTIYFPAESPVNSLFINIGAIMRDPIVAASALTEMELLECPECAEEYGKYNIRTLGAWSLPSYSLLCKPEVSSLESVRGLRIRSSGHTVTLASAIGATPSNMTYTEVYEGLQRNQIDCTFGSAVWLDSLSLGDVAKNVLRVDAGAVTAPSTYNIREDLWQSMPVEDRQVFVDTLPFVVAHAAFSYVNEENSVLDTPGRNYQVLQPDAAMVEAIQQQSEQDISAAIAKAEEAGVENAAEIVERFRGIYDKWEKLAGDVTTAEELEVLLKREIYDNYPID